MLLIMFPFLWKNNFLSIMYMSHFLCIIWHWHMLHYAGNHWAIGAWRAPTRGCFRPTSFPPPGTCMFRFLWKHHFFPCSIYVSDSFYYLKLTYVTLCSILVRHQCLKSTNQWPTSNDPIVTFMYRFLLIVILMIQHVLF